MIKWLDISLPTDVTVYNTDHQEYTTNDTRIAKNKLINQGVKTADVQYYNTDQESILSNTVTERMSTTITVIPHVLTGRLRRHLKPIRRS